MVDSILAISSRDRRVSREASEGLTTSEANCGTTLRVVFFVKQRLGESCHIGFETCPSLSPSLRERRYVGRLSESCTYESTTRRVVPHYPGIVAVLVCMITIS